MLRYACVKLPSTASGIASQGPTSPCHAVVPSIPLGASLPNQTRRMKGGRLRTGRRPQCLACRAYGGRCLGALHNGIPGRREHQDKRPGHEHHAAHQEEAGPLGAFRNVRLCLGSTDPNASPEPRDSPGNIERIAATGITSEGIAPKAQEAQAIAAAPDTGAAYLAEVLHEGAGVFLRTLIAPCLIDCGHVFPAEDAKLSMWPRAMPVIPGLRLRGLDAPIMQKIVPHTPATVAYHGPRGVRPAWLHADFPQVEEVFRP